MYSGVLQLYIACVTFQDKRTDVLALEHPLLVNFDYPPTAVESEFDALRSLLSNHQSVLADAAAAAARCCWRALCARHSSQVPYKAFRITPVKSAITQ